MASIADCVAHWRRSSFPSMRSSTPIVSYTYVSQKKGPDTFTLSGGAISASLGTIPAVLPAGGSTTHTCLAIVTTSGNGLVVAGVVVLCEGAMIKAGMSHKPDDDCQPNGTRKHLVI